MPGSARPSRNSSEAPPPVDRWSNASASPACFTASRRVPAADHAERVGVRDRRGHAARAGAERLELEHAHRPVPQDRLGVGDDARVLLDGPRADVEPHEPARDLGGGHRAPFRLQRHLRRRDHVVRHLDEHATIAARRIARPAPRRNGLARQRLVPTSPPSAAISVKAIAPPMSNASTRSISDSITAQLVADLRARRGSPRTAGRDRGAAGRAPRPRAASGARPPTGRPLASMSAGRAATLACARCAAPKASST